MGQNISYSLSKPAEFESFLKKIDADLTVSVLPHI